MKLVVVTIWTVKGWLTGSVDLQLPRRIKPKKNLFLLGPLHWIDEKFLLDFEINKAGYTARQSRTIGQGP